MTVDENDFFRQATLRICEHLDIEIGRAGWRCNLVSLHFSPALRKLMRIGSK